MGAKILKEIHKNLQKEKEIVLEDDEPRSEDICLNEEEEVERKLILTKKTQKDEIKNIGREDIALGDDFALLSKDFSSTSRDMPSNQTTEFSQPLFVECSLATHEIKNIERQKIALEDDFVRSEDSTSLKRCDSPNAKEDKIALEEDFSSVEDGCHLSKGNALGRQMSKDNNHFEKVNDSLNVMISTEDRSEFKEDYPSSNNVNGIQLQDKIHELGHSDEDMIKDPDYQLNTMSDIR